MDTLTDVFSGADVVIHLAWLIQPSRQREAMRRTNQGGTSAVARAAVAAGVSHLVHQSSVGTYAPGPGRQVDETWPTTGVPTSSYSLDKAAAERIVSAVEHDLIVTRVRPGLIFQDAAASEISRYFLGPLVPSALLLSKHDRLRGLAADFAVATLLGTVVGGPVAQVLAGQPWIEL